MFTERLSRARSLGLPGSLWSPWSPRLPWSRRSSSSRRIGRPGFDGRWLRLAAVAVAGLLWSMAADARAATRLPASDRVAIERTIRQQIAAFGREDADRAFAYATTDVQRRFGSSDRFLEAVRERYEPVSRAVGVQFVRLSRVDGEWVQALEITDDGGRVWHALFTMRRQADRRWRIGGCRLVESSERST